MFFNFAFESSTHDKKNQGNETSIEADMCTKPARGKPSWGCRLVKIGRFGTQYLSGYLEFLHALEASLLTLTPPANKKTRSQSK